MIVLSYKPPLTKDFFKVIEEAKGLAERALQSVMKAQIGMERPPSMRFIVFGDDGKIYPVDCDMAHQDHPELDEKDQLALMVKIIVHAVKSSIVLGINESWVMPPRCHQCRHNYSKEDWNERVCPKCCAEFVQPSEHPERSERMMAILTIFNGGKKDAPPTGRVYSYHIVRDESKRIKEYILDKENSDDIDELHGRFCEWWELTQHEAPHFLVNYPTFCDSLGVPCKDEIRAASQMAKMVCPPDYPLLQWGLMSINTNIAQYMTLDHPCIEK